MIVALCSLLFRAKILVNANNKARDTGGRAINRTSS